LLRPSTKAQDEVPSQVEGLRFPSFRSGSLVMMCGAVFNPTLAILNGPTHIA